MAVNQISKIQIRRGRAISGTGIPQLASGEMAWAVDTQELYIGNGAIAEGAPIIGNTKIITERDLELEFNLTSTPYSYKNDDVAFASSYSQTIQQRLDEFVSIVEFGAIPESDEPTQAIQQAIDSIYLNISALAVNDARQRIILRVPAGTYIIEETLYIPSYVTLVGDGIDKTIIKFNGLGSAIRLVNDNTISGTPSTIDSTLGVNQPRNITIANMTITTNNSSYNCLQLDCIKDCLFDNLKLQGRWDLNSEPNYGNAGIQLNALTNLVTCENNLFRNVNISGFGYGIYSDHDIVNNTFMSCSIGVRDAITVGYGIVFGLNTNNQSANQLKGPINTQVSNCSFFNTKYTGIYIKSGFNTAIADISLYNVAGVGSNELKPQIYFDCPGNSVTNVMSNRADLADVQSPLVYVPIVSGNAVYNAAGTTSYQLAYTSSEILIRRFPLKFNLTGVPTGTILYTIDYTYSSALCTRFGVMKIVADAAGTIQLADEYDFLGNSNLDILLEFYAAINNDTIVLSYTNNVSSDSGLLTLKYTAQS